jgi:hypothetical protein
MSMAQTGTTHFLFTGIPAWGHVRSLCILAARLANENENVVVTIILSPHLLDNAQAEISAEFGDGDSENARRRIRVLSTCQSNSSNPLELFKVTAETYVPAYQALTQAKSITCAVKGTVFEAVPAPAVVILDFFSFAQFQATRAITGQSVPIMAWMTGHASHIIRIFGPESLGGIGDLGAKIDAEAARLGVAAEEIASQVYNHTDGTVVKIPGLPDMYDYEVFPQKLPFEVPIWMILRGGYALLQGCDKVFIASAYAFENESLEAMKSWLSDWKKETYVVGPVLPLSYGSVAQSSRGALDIEAFLDRMLIQQGKNTVLLISFGTMFWPTSPEYVDEVIEALIEKKFPFIFCFASPFAKISNELAERVKLSGLGMVTQWAPQQFILNHPATGWFLSHCGHNSVMESLACGIPLISWPFEADQPAAAAHLTENLNIAFELIEVRTGDRGMKPLHRNGRAAKGTREAVGVEIREVIDACRGPKGEEMRKNAEDMKMKFAETWHADGVSRKELRVFLDKYI